MLPNKTFLSISSLFVKKGLKWNQMRIHPITEMIVLQPPNWCSVISYKPLKWKQHICETFDQDTCSIIMSTFTLLPIQKLHILHLKSREIHNFSFYLLSILVPFFDSSNFVNNSIFNIQFGLKISTVFFLTFTSTLWSLI